MRERDELDQVSGAGPPDDRAASLIPILLGFSCGVLAGAAIGLLMAPASGRDSRQWIAEHGRTVGRHVSPLLHPSTATAIVREGGVRRLWEVLRSGEPPAGGPTTS